MDYSIDSPPFHWVSLDGDKYNKRTVVPSFMRTYSCPYCHKVVRGGHGEECEVRKEQLKKRNGLNT
jgi:hypothetical protein